MESNSFQHFNDSQAGTDEGQIDIAKYLKLLRKYKWGIITLTLLGTILGALIVYAKTPLYRATCQLVLESQMPKLPTVEQILGLAAQDQAYLQTQYQIITSRGLAEIVAKKLNLYDPDKVDAGVQDIVAQASDSSIIDWFRDAFPVLRQRGQHISLTAEERRAQAAYALLGNLSVTPAGQTKIVNISYVSADPEMAAKIANTFASAFIENQMDSSMEMTRSGSQWLFERMNVLRNNLQAAEKKLQGFLEQQKLLDIGGGVSQFAEGKVSAASVELERARGEFAKISKRYGPKHPLYIAALADLNIAGNKLKEGKSEIRAINRKEVELRELRSQVDSDKALYDVFLKRVKETDQSLGLNKAQARILDPALRPLAPYAPNVKDFITMSAVGSFMLAIMLVLLNESLNKTIKSTSDVEDKLGQVTLGILPLLPALKTGAGKGFPMLNPDNASFAEAVRTIRTGIVLSGLDNPHKVILVTSSVPGEGKTTVSSSLAVALAQMENVLLVGADLRRPSLNGICGIQAGVPGLSELVAGSADFKTCIITDEETGLNILTGGMIPPNPLEILFSERFAKVLGTLEKYYDRIVIDSPPVDAVSDALVLARFAKTVVYVVEADKTPEAVVKHGLKRLSHHHAPLAGIVLNKVNIKHSEYYHGYYDKYGYSS